MVIDWHRRPWLLLSPLHAGIVILLWVAPCHAVLLKDIRIGEYDQFTRIVFEFNVQTGIDSIGKALPGELKVTFPEVHTEFSRPIPQKPSERLRNFEVWQHKDQLSIIFKFNYKNLRFDSFQLKNPPRLVVDVYPELSPTKTPVVRQDQITQETIPHTGSTPPLPTDSKTKESPLPLDRLSLHFNGKPSGSAALDSAATEKQTTGNQKIPIGSISIKPAISPQQPDQQQTKKMNDEAIATAMPPLSNKGLQFYLLVGLVILTIVILSLLVLMLISRHKWTNGKKTLKIEDLLHRQDEHIASINSQIEEHLKRYDEI